MKTEGISRREALEAFASRHGFRFLPDLVREHLPQDLETASEDDPAEVRLLQSFHGFWPVHPGYWRHVRDLAFGTYQGLNWTVFEFEHALLRESYGVMCGHVGVNLPRLHVPPEPALHHLESRLGLPELRLECEEFNERYFVRSDDERAAFAILHPQTLNYLLDLPARDWQIQGGQIVLARRGPYAVEELPDLMGEIDGFVRLIPGYVCEDRGRAPDWRGPFG